MHRAFSLGDVVHEIVTYLEKATLISLSQTCKALSSSALDALWREMTSLDPLYQTLPSGVWTKNDDGKLELGPSTPDDLKDWERFLVYASRIRELSFADDTPDLRPDFLTLMALYLPSQPGPPLPRLRALRIISRPYPDTELALCLTTLAHPGLRDFHVTSSSSATVLAMLSHMQHCCSDIHTLSISKSTGLLPMATRFTCLQKLVFDDPESDVDMRTIRALSRLPHLRHLSLNNTFSPETFSSVEEDTIGNENTFFPSLEELLLGDVTGVLALAGFVALIQPRSLRTISVTYSLSHQPARELRRLAESIALHRCLRTLTLRSQRPTVEAVKATDISSLEQLKSLRTVYLDDVLSFTAPECGVFHLVQHWPDVRTVHLDCTAWREAWPEAKIFTLGLVGEILVSCPRLEELRVAMRGLHAPTTVPSWEQRYTGPLRLFVDIINSSVDLESYDVAEYLTTIRPNIEIVCDGDAAGFEERRDMWLDVNEWASRINATRAVERERMESELLAVIGPA